MDKTFYLVRHAESLGNIGIDTGWDPHLSPQGHAQAARCAEFLGRFCDGETLLLASPFERCLMTAEQIARHSGLRIKIEVALHEFFAQEWYPVRSVRMASLKEKALAHPLVEGEYPDGRWWPERNENYEDLKVRMAMLRNRLLGAEFAAGTIVCVGHWISVQILVALMLNGIDMPVVDNASVTEVKYCGGRLSCGFINKTDWR